MSWLTRLRNALNPGRLDEDLADEVRDHIRRRASDLERKGYSPTEAEGRAALSFGNAAVFRERSRDIRLWAALEGTLQDIRYAWRGFRRNPAFGVTAVICLSLAIGANTAIYSIVDALMLRPLPAPQPDLLFALGTAEADRRGLPSFGEDAAAFSYPLYEELRRAAKGSARVELFDLPNRVEAQVGTPSEAPREEVIEQFVSPDAFETLGIPAASGRLFSSAEDRNPSPRAVVALSFDYWQRRFGADPAAVGRTMIVNGHTYSIAGVAREGFSGVEPGKFVDVWLPITLTDPGIFTNPEFRPFRLLGRLDPGATREQLAARLQPAFHNHQLERIGHGASMPLPMQKQLRDMRIVAGPGANGISAFRRTFVRPLWILLSIAIGVLLIACANVASLLLARSTARASEMAMRVSLGAGRVRLIRQLLTESMLISVLAGLGGWLLAGLAAPLLVAMVSRETDPVRLDLALDARVLLFCAAICTLSALFFGLLPAWQASGVKPMFALRHAEAQATRVRMGRLFVGIQVAFAFCLITGGAGFLFSLRNLTMVDTGFDPKGVSVLTVTNDLGPQQRDLQLGLMQQLQIRTAELPQVEGAATAWMAVFSGARRNDRVVRPGKPPSEREEVFYRISPGYFATLRTPLLSGRDFEFRDSDNEPVPTIVNRAFARRYFGTEAAVGNEFRRADGVRHQIVGIAADSHFGDLHNRPEPIAYMPMKPPKAFTLYVRSVLDAGTIAKMVDREAKALGSGMRVRDITTLETLVGTTILKEKLLAAIGGVFAVLGLVLAAIGLFGTLNYTVVRRTKEIGIRAALGATRSALLGLVLKDLTGIITGGLAAGLLGSLALMHFARSVLFGIRPVDPLVIGCAAAVFLATTALAGGIPVRRATAIDPVIALRHE
jgi:predicted permease